MYTTYLSVCCCFFFFQAEDGIRDYKVTGVQTCALPIYTLRRILQVPLVGLFAAAQVHRGKLPRFHEPANDLMDNRHLVLIFCEVKSARFYDFSDVPRSESPVCIVSVGTTNRISYSHVCSIN